MNETKLEKSNVSFVENVSHLIVGKHYLVPCIVFNANDKEYITPVINHPHNDVENGQAYIHYHTDYRFIRIKNIADQELNVPVEHALPIAINNHSKHIFAIDSRPVLNNYSQLVHIILQCVRTSQLGITIPSFVSKSKLKHKCIYKGKCPHRGMDLTSTEPVNGVIVCPLHGLKFNAKTKMLI